MSYTRSLGKIELSILKALKESESSEIPFYLSQIDIMCHVFNYVRVGSIWQRTIVAEEVRSSGDPLAAADIILGGVEFIRDRISREDSNYFRKYFNDKEIILIISRRKHAEYLLNEIENELRNIIEGRDIFKINKIYPNIISKLREIRRSASFDYYFFNWDPYFYKVSGKYNDRIAIDEMNTYCRKITNKKHVSISRAVYTLSRKKLVTPISKRKYSWDTEKVEKGFCITQYGMESLQER